MSNKEWDKISYNQSASLKSNRDDENKINSEWIKELHKAVEEVHKNLAKIDNKKNKNEDVHR